MHRRVALALALSLPSAGVLGAALQSPAVAADPSVTGAFGSAFQESGPVCAPDADQRSICKPAAASVSVLANGKLVYWDALEGMEDVKTNVVTDYGRVAQNDVTRLLDLSGPTWSQPAPVDAGANPQGNDNEYLPGVPHNNDDTRNDGDTFCSDQVLLADGRVLDVGGTSYYLEPGQSGVDYGVSELEGLKNARVYDPVSNSWSQTGSMAYGRWYPSLVTLANGKVLVASGVSKLIKPLYPDRPADSGTNVTQLETYDPATGTWTVNADSAKKSLPLYPRLHLLPDGRVYYDAAGQTFNPMGQAYDEALWNTAAVYDPKTQAWSDLGLPAFGPALKGFRGSGFSQMLTLEPDARGRYRSASFLSAGGVYGVTPGTYVASDTATVNRVSGSTLTSTNVAPMLEPRWYGTAVTLPTGQVLVFNGADRDEVDGPGSGKPVTTPEMYDPATNTWTKLAAQSHGRTYHNTAVLLPDGRVLVGGHSPIATGYASQQEAGTQLGLSSPHRDPSFEVFTPPNLFYGPRPVITRAPTSLRRGRTFTMTVDRDVESVTLVRNTALTHLIDADQRVVKLAIKARQTRGSRVVLTVAAPPTSAVAPTGPYLLFANARTAKGLTPSVSRQVFVGAKMPAAYKATVRATRAVQVRDELAAAAGFTRTPTSAAAAPASKAPAAAPAPHLTPAPAAPAADRRTTLSATTTTAVSRPASRPWLAAGLLGALGLTTIAVIVPRRRRPTAG